MTKPEGPTPPLPERIRMPARVAAVFIGYLIYFLVGDPAVAAVMIWVGFIAFAWAMIEQMTTYRKDQLSMMIVGQAILGIGLVVSGALMAMR